MYIKKQEKHSPVIDHGADGGIRTHVPFRTTRFRVELVMTTSIRLRTQLFYHILQNRENEKALIIQSFIESVCKGIVHGKGHIHDCFKLQ